MPLYSASSASGLSTSAPVTVGKLTKWATSTSLTDSLLSESGSNVTVSGNFIVSTGTISLSGTIAGRSSRTNSSTVDATLQGGSGNVLGTDDSSLTLKIISGQSAIFDNDGGILSLPTSGTVTIPAVYGGQNPAITNTGGPTTGSNTITTLAVESIAAQGTIPYATVTTAVALDIGAMTAGATNNYGIRIASSAGTGYRAIDVNSGSWYIDGSSNMYQSNNSMISSFGASTSPQSAITASPTFNGMNASILRSFFTGGVLGSNGTTPTITRVSGVEVGAMTVGTVSANTTITDFHGITILSQTNLSNITTTVGVGLDIQSVNIGTISNYGIRIASSASTGYRAIDVNAGNFYVGNQGDIHSTQSFVNGTEIIGGTNISGGTAQLYVTGSTLSNATQMAGIWAQPTLTLSSGNLNANTLRTQANITIISLASSLYNLAAVYVDGPTLSGGGATTTFGLPTTSTSGLSRIFVEPLTLTSTVATVSSAHGIYAFGPGGTGITTGYAAYFSAGTGSTNNYALGIGAQASPTTAALTITGTGNINTTGTITATGTFTTANVVMTNQNDVVGLTVRGFSVQTNSLQIWQTSAPTTIASMSNAGLLTLSSNLALNGGQITTTATGLGLPTYVNIGAVVSNTNQALAVTSTLAAPAASGFTYGLYHSPIFTLTNATTTGVGILTAPTINTATGVNISNAVGIQINPIVGTGGGTVTLSTLYGLYINSQTALTGISTLTTAYGAYIAGPSTGNTRYALFIAGGSTASQGLYVQPVASATVALATFDASLTTNAQKVTYDKTGHINISQAAAPTVASGTGLGTNSVAIALVANSTDQSGEITVTTSTAGTVNGIICTVTFRNAYSVAPNAIILTPGAPITAANSGGTTAYSIGTISATAFTIVANTVAFPAGAHKWFYHVL